MDYISDESGRQLVRLQRKMTLPEHAKQARLDYESVANLPDAAFGRPLTREFPLDTPGRVFLSMAYAKLAGIQDPALQHRLKRAGELYGISEDLARLDRELEEPAAESPTRRYALSLDLGEGRKEASLQRERAGGPQGFYPLDTPEDTATSAIQLGNDFPRLPRDLFAQAAHALIKAASEHRLLPGQVPRVVEKYGVERVPDWAVVKTAAQARFKRTGDQIYLELAASAEASPEDDELMKYAGLWHQADVLNELPVDRNDVLDAYEIFNSGMAKSAFFHEVDKWVLVGGTPVPKAVLANIPESEIRRVMTKAAAEQALAALTDLRQETGPSLSAKLQQLAPGVQNLLRKLAAATPE